MFFLSHENHFFEWHRWLVFPHLQFDLWFNVFLSHQLFASRLLLCRKDEKNEFKTYEFGHFLFLSPWLNKHLQLSCNRWSVITFTKFSVPNHALFFLSLSFFPSHLCLLRMCGHTCRFSTHSCLFILSFSVHSFEHNWLGEFEYFWLVKHLFSFSMRACLARNPCWQRTYWDVVENIFHISWNSITESFYRYRL